MVYLINLLLIGCGVVAALASLAPAASKAIGPGKLAFGGIAILEGLYLLYNQLSMMIQHGLPPVGFLQYLVFFTLKGVVALLVGGILVVSGLQKPTPDAPQGAPPAPTPPSPVSGIEGPVGLAAVAYAVISLVLFGLR